MFAAMWEGKIRNA